MRNNVAHWWTWNVPLSTGILVVAVFGLAPLFGLALAFEHRIALVALVMVALVPILVRWPVVPTFGVYALLACSFDVIPFLEESSLTKPAGVLAGAVLAASGLMERRLGRPPLAALWFGLFMVWAALSAAWALDPEAVFGRLKLALSLFFLYLVAVSFRPTRKELYWVCALTVVGGVMAAGVAYLLGLEEGGTGGDARGRIALGDYDSNPNALGRTLILPLALAIAGFVRLRGIVQRAMALGCVGVIGMGMYISMSRAAVAAMLTMITVLLYRVRVRWQIVAVTVILLALSAAMPDEFYRRVGTVITGEDATGSGRTEIWKVGLTALERFGIFGAGLENFTDVYDLYVPSTALGRAPHSTYLGAWVELGIIGLALMLAALASHLLAVQRARGAGHGGIVLAALEAACFGMLVLGIFGDQLWRKTFWLAWILLTWAIYCEREQDQPSDAPAFERVVR